MALRIGAGRRVGRRGWISVSAPVRGSGEGMFRATTTPAGRRRAKIVNRAFAVFIVVAIGLLVAIMAG